MNSPESPNKRSIGVPDLPRELLQDQLRNITYSTSTVPPFYTTTETLVAEGNNSDPNFVRSTFYILPTSEHFLENCGAPLALVATPFTERSSCPAVMLTSNCTQCHTFFNCFTKQNGNNLTCNICGVTQPRTETSQLDSLSLPSFELVRGEEPSSQKSAAFVFVFDFTFPGVNELALQVIKICQNEVFQSLYRYVSFVVLNHGISLFCLKDAQSGSKKQIIRVQVFGEAPELSIASFIRTSEIDVITRILHIIHDERLNLRDNLVPSFLSMLKTVSNCFSGIKAVLISNSKSTDYNYESFINEAGNVVVNVITESAVEIRGTSKSTAGSGNFIQQLAFHTGGSVSAMKYKEFARIACELQRIALARTVFRVSLILKVSDNLVKTAVISPSIEEDLTVTQLPGMDSLDAVTFQLSLAGLSRNAKYCQLQAYYTDADGTRYIRCFNYAFATGNPQQFYAGMSFDTIFAVLCKLEASDGSEIETPLIKALSFYRARCSEKSSATQLVLPDALKCLPVLIQSFYKKDKIDRAKLIKQDVEQILRYFYPRLVSLVEYSTQLPAQLSVTPSLRLSLKNLSDTDLYILENGEEIYIYLPSNIDPALVDALFCGCDDEDASTEFVHGVFALRRAVFSTSTSDGVPEECAVLRGILTQIMGHYGKDMSIRVILSGTAPDDVHFVGCMVEDALNGKDDYIDYIFRLHFKVQNFK